eukprot:4789774-Pyramimonas_sp.AAC.1
MELSAAMLRFVPQVTHISPKFAPTNRWRRRHSPVVCLAKNQGSTDKKVWVRTENKQVMTAAVEAGLDTFVFTKEKNKLAEEWSNLVRISACAAALANLENDEASLINSLIGCRHASTACSSTGTPYLRAVV